MLCKWDAIFLIAAVISMSSCTTILGTARIIAGG
jgi:hypothetical protein